jgi:hypothetical protein
MALKEMSQIAMCQLLIPRTKPLCGHVIDENGSQSWSVSTQLGNKVEYTIQLN